MRGAAVAVLVLTHVAAAGAGFLLAGRGPAGEPLCECRAADRQLILDVPFVPTPPEVVAEMLELAEVGPADVVYDLGSGDGRIVIAAARDRGARAVGIEIDPELVSLSRRRAEEAGVSGRVAFREQDFFEADFSDATVVTLYLLPEVNRRLRPLLLRQLPVGARIVAHDFDMVDWPPEETRSVRVHDRAHTVLLWTVPERAAP